MKKKKIAMQLGLQVLLIGASILAIMPFLYMLATALTKDTYTMPNPPILIPKEFYTGNFVSAWTSNSFSRYFLNSLFVSLVTMVLTLAISTASAYGFAKLRFRGRNVIFNVYLFSMMIPAVLALVSQYTVLNGLNLIDTYRGLILLYISGGIAGNTYFLKGFIEQLPNDYEESVMIDGGSRFTVFSRIILPLCRPSIATLAILSFMGTWDEFFAALTIIKTASKRTLPIAIRLFQGQNATQWGLVFAAALIALIPILIIYITFQKYFIKETDDGGVKG
ncbi:carbohydrate ABC transporter permease [Paenibacillus anaericanus]|uniref:Carbohydrate ABC transporter permease n=1 Tax=Paenibacillus anaericanus TaxID=170367 RepID=A0A3S1BPS3_9BACL|nr:carbohydrate ABC transporter permease [Paenibacillus anaericanus]RUT46676.1 carbohydrate ABC transporter permease [Paenibacillus anaericanus]